MFVQKTILYTFSNFLSFGPIKSRLVYILKVLLSNCFELFSDFFRTFFGLFSGLFGLLIRTCVNAVSSTSTSILSSSGRPLCNTERKPSSNWNLKISESVSYFRLVLQTWTLDSVFRLGIQTLTSELTFRHGLQTWTSALDFSLGLQTRTSDSYFRLGLLTWT